MRFYRALLLVVFLSGIAYGQGVIIPDCRQCPPRPIPRPLPLPRALKVKSVKITTKIDSQVATTKVEQVFENDTPHRLEGSFFFPIPESASITDFAIFDGDKRMAAEVMERAKARQIYNEIVRKMIDPGLLEYAGKDLFQANVFPIEPRSTRKIELTYSQVLKNEAGTVSYRYELGAGRRILTQPIGQISASIEINSPIDLKTIFSPSHRIAVNRSGERRATLSFEGSGEEAQRDFQLYYSLSEKEFGVSLLTHREPGKDGYYLLLISPKVNVGEQERAAKDVVFVFDTSGSMSGDKIEKAKAVLRFGVESLAAQDKFNIVSFSGEEHLMKSSLVEASKQARQEALSFINKIRAEGGTNINDSLVTALGQFQPSQRPQMLVFLTDGLPTVGTTDIREILKNVAYANRAKVRIFSFGVGYDVNTNLLDKLSLDNQGMSDYITPGEDLEIKVSGFFAKVNYPVLSDLVIDFGKLETEMQYPRDLPDLFKGSQLVIVGRYKDGPRKTTVTLTGNVGDRLETLSFTGQSFPSEEKANNFLPRLWATRRVGYLLEQIRLNGENRELVDEIVGLGTRFGIVTPYTSFLVTEDMKAQARSGARDEELQRRYRAMQPNAAGRPAPSSGEMAVMRSKAEREIKEADGTDSFVESFTNVRVIGSKTFMLKNGAWFDTEYREDAGLPKVTVTFGSEEFFKLLADKPELGKFFALGKKVIVVFEGTVYQSS